MKTLMLSAAMMAGIVVNAHAGPLPEAKPDDVGFLQRGLTRLDDFFAREIAAKRVPGAVVAVSNHRAHGLLPSFETPREARAAPQDEV